MPIAITTVTPHTIVVLVLCDGLCMSVLMSWVMVVLLLLVVVLLLVHP